MSESPAVLRRLFSIVLFVALLSACNGSEKATAPDLPVPDSPTPTIGGDDPGPAPDAPVATAVVTAPTPGPTATTGPPTPTPTPKPAPRTDVEEDGWVTHTLATLTERDDYFSLSRSAVGGQQITKFTIIDFFREADVVFYDSNFYTLHDEWYWFRLLNGRSVPGSPDQPVQNLSFDTVDEVYEWALPRQDNLPLGLEFFRDDRLATTDFYAMAGTDSRPDRMLQLGFSGRHFGLGSVVFVPASETESESWLLELEFQDTGGPEIIAQFFDRIIANVPPEIGDNLKWVVRSPQQEITAQRMENEGLRFSDRIVRYSELVADGQVEVYNAGISAGRVTRIAPGDDGRELSEADELSILVTEFVPDYLPPATALLTQNPQTPLAHVNILAANRGIPNASQGALLDDPALNSMARVRAAAIVLTKSPDQLRILQMTEAEFVRWLELRSNTPIAVPTIDLTDAPLTLDLATVQAGISRQIDIDDLRPLIGGKAAGFLGLLSPGSVTMPESPSVITVAAYREHLEQVQPALDAMLANQQFVDSPLARFLLLEGPNDYADVYTQGSETVLAEEFRAAHPSGTIIGDILDADGFKSYLRDAPMKTATLQAITAFVEDQYADHHVMQGLRFRSSSSVEDIEGFNGAGLYDSNTGFRSPELQTAEKDQKKSLEWAIKKTWASYWSFEAFEERQLENVDHESGAMAVLVHARFDDPLELSNGVFTLAILPANDPHAEVEMVINVQAGAESVTNPTPGLNALPEVDVVRLTDGGIEIERRQDSSLVAPGERILSDDKLREIFAQGTDVAREWLALSNTDPLPNQQSSTVVLDFEFREMAAGWPQLVPGETPHPERIVIKQARTLDPGTRGLANAIRSLPIPDDIESRATRVEQTSCTSANFNVTVVEVFTDPLAIPDMGFDEEPFLASVDLNFTAAVGAEVGIGSGVNLAVDWSNFGLEIDNDPTTVEVVPRLSTPIGTFERLRLNTSTPDGSYVLLNAEGSEVSTGSLSCSSTKLLVTAEDYLFGLVAATDRGER